MADDGASGSAPSDHPRSYQDAASQPAHVLDSEVVMTHELKWSFNRHFNRRMINGYEFDHRIGRGQHGEVYLARDTTKDRMQVAVKAVKRKNARQDKLNKLRKRHLPESEQHLPLTEQLGSTEHKIRKEIAIMKKCRHPHVVRLLEVIDDRLAEKIYMVMEYLGGGEIKWRTPNDEPVLRVDQTRRICRDVILGLEYLHHQGIIHRDIKPANLLWSADRRTVKITDFGVSHFSYAQRLAAAGKGTIPSDDNDPILMDDSDLSRTAGTPMFLAPEIVSDIPTDASSSQLQLTGARRKPPITKAIDVWALGVTLYGLLFGHLPFNAESEYLIFQVIRKQDWTVEDTMGVDRLPTGGRYQKSKPKDERLLEGYYVIKLLERLLEKDSRKRITLEEVKRHPWILRDLENPDQWLRETQLDRDAAVEPTPAETNGAMSSVRFRWSMRVANRITDLIRNVRPQRSFWSSNSPAREVDEYKNVGVRSAPHMRAGTPARRSSNARQQDRHPPRPRAGEQGRDPREREKGKQRANVARNKSTTDVGRVAPHEEKGFDPWGLWAAGEGTGSKRRRGSFPSRLPVSLDMPARSRMGSPQHSPAVTTPSGEGSGPHSPDERPRSRLSLQALWPFRRQPPADAGAGAGADVARSKSAKARRSEDAFNVGLTSGQSSASSPLTLAMRAASWGEVPDRGYQRSADDLSFYSNERADDALDVDTLMIGAGGVAHSPVTSLSTSSSSTSLSPVTSSSLAISAAQAILQRAEQCESASTASTVHLRVPKSSPLAQTLYNRTQRSIESVVSSREAEYDDDVSVFERESRSSVISYGEVELQPSTSQRYQDDDEEDSDEDEIRLEVRPRRPSVSAAELSRPRRSESSHREHTMICT